LGYSFFLGVFFFQVLLMMEECDGFLPCQVLQDISAERDEADGASSSSWF
jgi:hypothetical protein